MRRKVFDIDKKIKIQYNNWVACPFIIVASDENDAVKKRPGRKKPGTQ